ncbi:succinylglutamate desuccinylase/aspartoacylase family protein [Vibrio sp. YIC-376]|uniref:succinylglutamate desuccinylase/aspartoacylase family protein n=1 Tax=Vibrio sp. YIC-376 TaxID=3136162 RepID=UPI00402AFFA4
MQHQQTPLISPVIGTQRYIDSFHFGQTGSGKKIYIQASLHADELPGMLVAWKLKQQLVQLEADGQIIGEIVVVPVANPIGQNQHLMDIHLGRYELENGHNFNRGYFDTFSEVKQAVEGKLTDDKEANKQLIRTAMKTALDNWHVETEFQSQQKALQMLSHDADVMLDLHCDFEAILHFYSTYYSWEGIEPLARLLGSEVNMLADDTGGNPFDCSVDMVWQRLNTEFGDIIPRGCVGTTVELRGQADVYDEYADQDSQGILHYLHTLGVIKGDFATVPSRLAPSSDLAAVETLKSTQGGVLVLKVKAGEWVEPGQVFAEVINPITDQVEQVTVTQAGRVYSRTNRRTATAGMLIGNVAGENIIRSGYLLAP